MLLKLYKTGIVMFRVLWLLLTQTKRFHQLCYWFKLQRFQDQLTTSGWLRHFAVRRHRNNSSPTSIMLNCRQPCGTFCTVSMEEGQPSSSTDPVHFFCTIVNRTLLKMCFCIIMQLFFLPYLFNHLRCCRYFLCRVATTLMELWNLHVILLT